eukprot:834175-Prymnesium_polylepis.1
MATWGRCGTVGRRTSRRASGSASSWNVPRARTTARYAGCATSGEAAAPRSSCQPAPRCPLAHNMAYTWPAHTHGPRCVRVRM